MGQIELGDNVGICQKDLSGTIQCRDQKVIDTCGLNCNQICLRYLRDPDCKDPHVHLAKFRAYPRLEISKDHFANVLVISDNEHITTVIYPLDSEIEASLERLKAYDLTPTEIKIASMTLKGLANQLIADRLFISRATLKKHLNNIYKKIPTDLRPRRA